MHDRTEIYRALKVKLCKILTTVEYCCICLENNLTLSSVNDLICVSNWEGNHYITAKHLLTHIFCENDYNSISSEYICTDCMEKSISTYNFIYNSKRTFEILSNYLTQLDVEVKNVFEGKEELTHTAFVLDDPPCTTSEEDHQRKELIKESTFICDYCNEVFTDLEVLKQHIDQNHFKLFRKNMLKTNLGCTECKRQSCSHQKYIKHFEKETVKGKKTVKCLDCAKTYSSIKCLISHVNKYHLQSSPLNCEVCNQKFPSTSSLANHNKIIHNFAITCDYCCKLFSDSKKLGKHIEECKDIIRAHQCDHCPASFNSITLLKRHVKHHLNVYACDTCLRTFPNEFSLKQHKKRHCIKYSELTCLYCGEMFDTIMERELHISEHDANEKPYCKHCDTHFVTEDDYNNHLDTVGQRNKYSCEHCTYQAATANILEAHVNRYHLKIMPYKCTVCPKKFTNINLQKLHMKTHDKNKRHQCHICTKMFCGSMALKKHIRLHTGERPYLCDLCGERFVSSSLRSDHKARKHSKEKTVKCPFCDYKFYTPRDMREHFKNNHWKVKGEKFDVRKVKGLKPEELELFRDRRILML